MVEPKLTPKLEAAKWPWGQEGYLPPGLQGARGAFSSSKRNWSSPSCSKTLRAQLPFPQPRPWHPGRDTLPPAPGPGTLLLDAPLCDPRAGGGQGSCRGDPKEPTSSSLPASPLCRRGTTLRPQLRLALEQLWVLSGGKEAAGEEEEEEEEGSNEDRSSLILAWPTGSCVATFGSRSLKELWVGTLLGTPEGAKRARLTRLPSIKALEKELSRRHAWRTLSARSLERLMEGQAEVRMAAFHPPLAVPRWQGCAASGVGLCGRVGGSHGCHSGSGEGWGATRNVGKSSLAVLGGNLRHRAGSLGGQRVPTLPRSVCWCWVAARRWPLLLRGCSLSAAWFLQADPKQGPPTAPSANGGGLCRSAGEFWIERQPRATG
ncbi:uncharacterized protein LJ206_006805 [Theristicus caerulescens]